MITFFNDLEPLQQFTLSLDYHQDKMQCIKCLQHDQFVSHGFVYKKQRQGNKGIVGKRIFCSNRYGRNGCGSTHRLYLAEQVPTLQYTTDHLFRFLFELIAYVSIQNAYHKATGTESPRHAYRWLNKLTVKLSDYRTVIVKQWQDLSTQFKSRTHRFQLLLSTLQYLFVSLDHQPVTEYQVLNQDSFI
ncbi:MAG: hypothetical protein GXP08_01630 [Gammaproteobacteria bacterium]|nr:hypothetical protein [Gammaproteobacteria bacterium]